MPSPKPPVHLHLDLILQPNSRAYCMLCLREKGIHQFAFLGASLKRQILKVFGCPFMKQLFLLLLFVIFACFVADLDCLSQPGLTLGYKQPILFLVYEKKPLAKIFSKFFNFPLIFASAHLKLNTVTSFLVLGKGFLPFLWPLREKQILCSGMEGTIILLVQTSNCFVEVLQRNAKMTVPVLGSCCFQLSDNL